MTLYDDLGVDKDASEAEIRRAYRRKAKEEHPDAGGSAEKFGALVAAYDVLSDPGRRKAYDDTGYSGERRPVVERAEEIIAAAFSQLIDEHVDDKGLCVVNLVDRIAASLRRSMPEGSKAQQNLARDIQRWTRLKERTEGKVFRGILDQRIAHLRRATAENSYELEAAAKALELLKNYRHDQDKRPDDLWSSQVTQIIIRT